MNTMTFLLSTSRLCATASRHKVTLEHHVISIQLVVQSPSCTQLVSGAGDLSDDGRLEAIQLSYDASRFF